jgi:hypothetical protein
MNLCEQQNADDEHQQQSDCSSAISRQHFPSAPLAGVDGLMPARLCVSKKRCTHCKSQSTKTTKHGFTPSGHNEFRSIPLIGVIRPRDIVKAFQPGLPEATIAVRAQFRKKMRSLHGIFSKNKRIFLPGRRRTASMRYLLPDKLVFFPDMRCIIGLGCGRFSWHL